MSESCHTNEWIVSQKATQKMGLVARSAADLRPWHIKESCRTYAWVMSHIWMSRVTKGNAEDGFGRTVSSQHSPVKKAKSAWKSALSMVSPATRCTTLQHTAIYTATHCNTFYRIGNPRCAWQALQHSAEHCNTKTVCIRIETSCLWNMKRALYIWKEPYIYEKSPCIWIETSCLLRFLKVTYNCRKKRHLKYEKSPLYMKSALSIWRKPRYMKKDFMFVENSQSDV